MLTGHGTMNKIKNTLLATNAYLEEQRTQLGELAFQLNPKNELIAKIGDFPSLIAAIQEDINGISKEYQEQIHTLQIDKQKLQESVNQSEQLVIQVQQVQDNKIVEIQQQMQIQEKASKDMYNEQLRMNQTIKNENQILLNSQKRLNQKLKEQSEQIFKLEENILLLNQELADSQRASQQKISQLTSEFEKTLAIKQEQFQLSLDEIRQKYERKFTQEKSHHLERVVERTPKVKKMTPKHYHPNKPVEVDVQAEFDILNECIHSQKIQIQYLNNQLNQAQASVAKYLRHDPNKRIMNTEFTDVTSMQQTPSQNPVGFSEKYPQTDFELPMLKQVRMSTDPSNEQLLFRQKRYQSDAIEIRQDQQPPQTGKRSVDLSSKSSHKEMFDINSEQEQHDSEIQFNLDTRRKSSRKQQNMYNPYRDLKSSARQADHQINIRIANKINQDSKNEYQDEQLYEAEYEQHYQYNKYQNDYGVQDRKYSQNKKQSYQDYREQDRKYSQNKKQLSSRQKSVYQDQLIEYRDKLDSNNQSQQKNYVSSEQKIDEQKYRTRNLNSEYDQTMNDQQRRSSQYTETMTQTIQIDDIPQLDKAQQTRQIKTLDKFVQSEIHCVEQSTQNQIETRNQHVQYEFQGDEFGDLRNTIYELNEKVEEMKSKESNLNSDNQRLMQTIQDFKEQGKQIEHQWKCKLNDMKMQFDIQFKENKRLLSSIDQKTQAINKVNQMKEYLQKQMEQSDSIQAQLNHGLEIIQYFNKELENYKQVYNIFQPKCQQSTEPIHRKQLNIVSEIPRKRRIKHMSLHEAVRALQSRLYE